MNTRSFINRVGLLIGGLLALFGSTTVLAAAGDLISNRATVSYDVGTAAQTPIESSPSGNTTPGVGLGADTDFVEDRIVNFSVAVVDTALVTVAPGETVQVTEFTVTNIDTGAANDDSNGEIDFRLTPVNRSNGTANPFGAGTDNFDLTGLQVFVDSTVPGNGYQSGVDTATFIDELAPGSTAVTVYVVGTIPAGQSDDDIAVVSLVATAAESLTATDGTGVLDTGNLGADLVQNTGADVVGTIDNVFMDGAGDTDTAGTGPDAANDGFHSDSSGYIVDVAELTVTKSSAVISDPINGTTNPKAIPGAVIEYTITIANAAGAATAALTGISDDLTTAIITDTSVDFDVDAYDSTGTATVCTGASNCGFLVVAPGINGGSAEAFSSADDSDGADYEFSAGVSAIVNVESAALGSITGGQQATVQFRVIVQ